MMQPHEAEERSSPTDAQRNRAGLAWAGLLLLALFAACALVTMVGRLVQDLGGLALLLLMGAATVWTRLRFGHDHRPRLRDGAHTLLLLAAWGAALAGSNRLDLEMTGALAAVAVAGAFAIAALLALVAPRWLLAPRPDTPTHHK